MAESKFRFALIGIGLVAACGLVAYKLFKQDQSDNKGDESSKAVIEPSLTQLQSEILYEEIRLETILVNVNAYRRIQASQKVAEGDPIKLTETQRAKL